MTRLIIWRHGQTTWNAGGRVMGQTDVELSDLGRVQAEAAARRLAELAPDRIIASDLRRAVDTAAPLAELTGLDVTLDSRLRERFFGQWQGRTRDEIARRWPTEYAQWLAGEPLGFGIEGLEDLTKRCAEALADAVTNATTVPVAETIVVATHGAVGRQGCAALLGWPAPLGRTLRVMDNCHWAELRLHGDRGWQMWSYNVQ